MVLKFFSVGVGKGWIAQNIDLFLGGTLHVIGLFMQQSYFV